MCLQLIYDISYLGVLKYWQSVFVDILWTL